MTSTSGAWSGLFHGLPNRTPASQLYTEEAIQNDQLTADEIIEKAQSNAALLVDMMTASTEDDSETLQSFNDNDLIQTLHQQCQEISDYLNERIWYDSGDSRGNTYSSSSASQSKTVEEEAQIAAFISCNEQIQTAFRQYRELKDHLHAKEFQEEENARFRSYNVVTDTPSLAFDDSVVDSHASRKSASAAVARVFGRGSGSDDKFDSEEEESDFANGMSIAGHDARQIHLRKSEQPLVWRLDPREDFKANKNKNKKWIDRAEKDRLDQERMLERSPRNGIHGLAPEPEPLEIAPEEGAVAAAVGGAAVPSGGDLVAPAQEDVTNTEVVTATVAATAEGSQSAQTTTSNSEEAQVVLEAKNVNAEEEEEEDYGIEKIQNRIVVAEDDNDDEEEEAENDVDDDDDEGVLSDDSWEEISEQGILSSVTLDQAPPIPPMPHEI